MSDDAAIWDAYNMLLLGSDVDRLRKLFTRYELFRMSLDVPGDIVECGVLKGSSLMLFLKLLHIHAHGSSKRVIGLDMFTSFPSKSTHEQTQVDAFVAESGFKGITPESLYKKIDDANLDRTRCDLIVGDITETAFAYVAKNPGLRISLLHLDLDLEAPTFTALEAFWPRVVRGGIVILDEYAVSRWTESNGVDRFFSDKDVKLQTLPWSRTPTAYVVKGKI
ncbi:MAG: class I SAM-dependent methyltransferase [Anaerolineae bacterium]|nr:class I SAM-dependent methyltransferase [Anaerolineae bacterium]